MRRAYKILVGKRQGLFGELGVDEIIILKRVLERRM
jgi:hypothetical protein